MSQRRRLLLPSCLLDPFARRCSHMTTGVACATFPMSSSACMIFFILATGNLDAPPLLTILEVCVGAGRGE